MYIQLNDELSRVREWIISHPDIMNPTMENIKNTLVIENGAICEKVNGEYVNKVPLDCEHIIALVSCYTFPDKSPFKFYATSPFEADRKRDIPVWNNAYSRIDFPKAVPIHLAYLYLTGRAITFWDFAHLYLSLYTTPVNLDERISKEKLREMLNLNNPYIGNLDFGEGKNLTFPGDDRVISNDVIRFTQPNDTMPINQFTVEMMLNRLYKAYGSLMRDVIFPLQLYKVEQTLKTGATIKYNLVADVCMGIDLIVNDIYVCASTWTNSAHEFNKIKRGDFDSRHRQLKECYTIELEAEIASCDGVFLYGDKFCRTFLTDLVNKAYAPKQEVIAYMSDYYEK